MKLIFEDNSDSPMSRMFSRVLGNDVVFAGGNELLSQCIEDTLQIDNNIICFVDFVEDNIRVSGTYSDLVADFGDRVKIVKIPCMEVFAYMLLNSLSINREFKNADNTILEYCLGNIDSINDKYYVQSSFEKYIKALTEIKPTCINTHGNKENNKGKFYYLDCNCGEKYCKLLNKDILLINKFKFVYNRLPLSFNSKQEIVECDKFDWYTFYDREHVIEATNNTRKYGYSGYKKSRGY